MIYTFGDLLRDVHTTQEVFFSQLKNTFLEYISDFENRFIGPIASAKHRYMKSFDSFYGLIQMMPNFTKKQKGFQLEPKILEAKRMMDSDKINYLDSVNDLIIHSKIDLVDQICVSIYAFTSMFKQAN